MIHSNWLLAIVAIDNILRDVLGPRLMPCRGPVSVFRAVTATVRRVRFRSREDSLKIVYVTLDESPFACGEVVIPGPLEMVIKAKRFYLFPVVIERIVPAPEGVLRIQSIPYLC